MIKKCYIVEDPDAYEFGCTTAFAETASKARFEAFHHVEMGDHDTKQDFLRYKARRFPEGDRLYKPGKFQLDWDVPEDRLVLVKYAGWYCSEENTEEECGCSSCPAREFCPRQEVKG